MKETQAEKTLFFWETDSGNSGYIEAETIEEARAAFKAEHPDIDPACAGIWEPGQPEYPDEAD